MKGTIVSHTLGSQLAWRPSLIASDFEHPVLVAAICGVQVDAHRITYPAIEIHPYVPQVVVAHRFCFHDFARFDQLHVEVLDEGTLYVLFLQRSARCQKAGHDFLA